MSDLAAFLLARIAADEVAARAATLGAWRTERSKHVSGGYVIGITGRTICHAADMSVADAAHIARHDPARVLAECAARRQIVAMHEHDRDPVFCVMCQWEGDEFCPTLRALALPYADHPDFRDEWQA